MEYTTDEKVKVEKEESNWRKGALTYKHPSYGMIRVSRQTGSTGTPLFGAKTESNSIMSLVIKKAQNTQNLGSNWYYGYDTIVEAHMTPVQYAELISNPNTEGVPCTLHYTQENGSIKYRPHNTEIEYIDEKIKDSLDTLGDKLSDKKARAKDLLTQKGSLKKADKEELLNIIINMDKILTDSVPFYKGCMEEAIEGMKTEAKCDIESLVANVQTKLGKTLIDNPTLLDSLLSDTQMLENKKD